MQDFLFPRPRQNIGYVPQLLSADGELTGYENLLLSTQLYGLPRSKREKRIHEVLDFMGLTEYADKLVNQYSGGMIRRLEIAQALVHDPSVLFLDEPTVGLDPVHVKPCGIKYKNGKNNLAPQFF